LPRARQAKPTGSQKLVDRAKRANYTPRRLAVKPLGVFHHQLILRGFTMQAGSKLKPGKKATKSWLSFTIQPNDFGKFAMTGLSGWVWKSEPKKHPILQTKILRLGIKKHQILETEKLLIVDVWFVIVETSI